MKYNVEKTREYLIKFISDEFNNDIRYRLVYLFGLISHVLYLIMFFALGVKELGIFNVISVLIYLLGAIFAGNRSVSHNFMFLMYIEIVLHGALCGIYLGWEYGFSLYCMVLIPISFFITYLDNKFTKPIITSSALTVGNLAIMATVKYFVYNHSSVYSFPTEIKVMLSEINMFMSDAILLVFSILFIVKMHGDLKELKTKNEKLDFLAHYDMLTELRNRHSMSEIFAEYEKSAKPYCVALGDIDDFKRVNDTYGHAAGDKVLKTVSSVIKKHVGDKGVVCRWGGEEILIIMDGTTEECLHTNEKIRIEIQNLHLTHERKEIRITMTFGFCDYGDAMNIEKLISIADKRLYVGKQNGKNQVVSS